MLQGQIFIDIDEMKGDMPLHEYILHFLSENNVQGATSFRGDAGFGKNRHIKRPNELFSFDEPPIVITFIDNDSVVRETITKLRQEVTRSLITVHPVEIL